MQVLERIRRAFKYYYWLQHFSLYDSDLPSFVGPLKAKRRQLGAPQSASICSTLKMPDDRQTNSLLYEESANHQVALVDNLHGIENSVHLVLMFWKTTSAA